MKNLKNLMVYSYLLLSLSACSQDESITPIKEYETCCGAEPVEFNIELNDGTKAYIFTPNAFTPNSDGINDVFSPVLSKDINYMLYLVIQKEVFDDTTSSLLYQVENITLENFRSLGWNGLDKLGNPHKGAFTYTAFCATKDGKTFLIKGKACAIICDNDAAYFKDKQGCFFPVQANTAGILNQNQTNMEDQCFGNWKWKWKWKGMASNNTVYDDSHA